MTTGDATAFAWGVAGDLVGFVMVLAVLLLGLSLLGLAGRW